eukprot:scaffold75_cov217-Pinguiococcus_pyrenoidosus.AAC.13
MTGCWTWSALRSTSRAASRCVRKELSENGPKWRAGRERRFCGLQVSRRRRLPWVGPLEMGAMRALRTRKEKNDRLLLAKQTSETHANPPGNWRRSTGALGNSGMQFA